MKYAKAIGIRTSPTEIRYAILSRDANDKIIFVNADSENKLVYPASLSSTQEKLLWLKAELDRIFRQENDIEIMTVKTNEFAGTENKSKRESAYADAICMLVAVEHNVAVVCKLYTQILSSSKETTTHAEERVGRTGKYWNSKIADAVLAAYSAMR